MKPHTVNYPLAVGSELYIKVADALNPKMDGCTDLLLLDDSLVQPWEVFPLSVQEYFIKMLLYNMEEQYVGVEIIGNLSYTATPAIRWFNYHKQNSVFLKAGKQWYTDFDPKLIPVYHHDLSDALNDPDAWLPEYLKWHDEQVTEGHMDWHWWKQTISSIENTFKLHQLSGEDWSASPGLFKQVGTLNFEKTSIICTNDITKQHLGFLFLQDDCRHAVQSHCYFAVFKSSICCYSSFQDALSMPQDLIADFEVARYTPLALNMW